MEVECRRDMREAVGPISCVPEKRYAISPGTKPLVMDILTASRLEKTQFMLNGYAAWLKDTNRSVEASGSMKEYIMHCAKNLSGVERAQMAGMFKSLVKETMFVADRIKKDGGKIDLVSVDVKKDEIRQLVDHTKMKNENVKLRSLFVSSLTDSDVVLDLGSGGGVLRDDLKRVGKYTRVLSMDLKEADPGVDKALHIVADFNKYFLNNTIMGGITVVYMGHSYYHLQVATLRKLEVECVKRRIRMVALTCFQYNAHKDIKTREVDLRQLADGKYSGRYYNRIVKEESIYTSDELAEAGYLTVCYADDANLVGLGIGLFQRSVRVPLHCNMDDDLVALKLMKKTLTKVDLTMISKVHRTKMIGLGKLNRLTSYYVSYKIDGEQLIMLIEDGRIYFVDRLNNIYTADGLEEIYSIPNCVLQCEALRDDDLEDNEVLLFPVAVLRSIDETYDSDFLVNLESHYSIINGAVGYRFLNLKQFSRLGVQKLTLEEPVFPTDGVVFTSSFANHTDKHRKKRSLVLNFYTKPLKSYDIEVRTISKLPYTVYVKQGAYFLTLDQDLMQRKAKLALFSVVELLFIPTNVWLSDTLTGPCYLMLHGRVDKLSFEQNHSPSSGDLLKLAQVNYPFNLQGYIRQMARCRFDPRLKKDTNGLSLLHIFEPLMRELEKRGPDNIAGSDRYPLTHDGEGNIDFLVRYDWLVRCYKRFGYNKELQKIIEVLENDKLIDKSVRLERGKHMDYGIHRVYYRKLKFSEMAEFVDIYKAVVPMYMWTAGVNS